MKSVKNLLNGIGKEKGGAGEVKKVLSEEERKALDEQWDFGPEEPYDEKLEFLREGVEGRVKGVHGHYFHYADKLGVLSDHTHPVRKMASEIYEFVDMVRDCETMEELNAIDKKMRQYSFELKAMKEKDNNAPRI